MNIIRHGQAHFDGFFLGGNGGKFFHDAMKKNGS